MHCCLVLVVFAAASAPYFIFNTLEFGHPFKTGYDFWVPGASLFSLHNVPAQLAMLWSEITANWNQYRVANIFGTGTYVVPAFICLSHLGLAFVRLNRFTVSAFLAGMIYFIATLTYAFVDGRFYLPVFFLLIASGRFTCRVGGVPGSQAAPFHLNGWGADDFPAHLYWLSIAIRL